MRPVFGGRTILIVLLLWPVAGRAADNSKGGLGLLLGTGFRGSAGAALSYELKFSYRLLPAFMTSLFYYRANTGTDIAENGSALSTSVTTWALGGEMTYSFPNNGAYVGAKAGLITLSSQVSGTYADASGVKTPISIDASHTTPFIAPTIGYDYPVGSFSVGGEASYYFAFSSSVPKILALMALGKFNF